jgi:hypothetical protein
MSDGKVGTKPTALDPGKTLSEDSGTEDKEVLERAAEEAAKQVDEPQYPKVESEIFPPTQPHEIGREILAGGFNSTQSVPEYIRGTLDQLNTIQRYFVGRDMQKIQRRQVLKLCEELFQYQYQDIQHVLMLGMDIQKKTRFAQYIDASKTLQNRIQGQSATAQRLVISTMFDNRVEAFKEKNKRDSEFDRLFKKGTIDKKQYEISKVDNEKITWEHVEKLNQTMQLLIIRHTEFLYKTLELFKTKLIEKGVLQD